MDDKKFEKLDQKLFEGLKPRREKKVPWEILRGFSASVEERILKRQKRPSYVIKPVLRWLPGAVPVMAVLLLASWVTLRLPGTPQSPVLTPTTAAVQLAQLPAAEVSDEIAALREVGAWNEDDEAVLDLADESDLENLA